jgi:N-acetylglutamate synthase-like GNAT family acetyltransferase
MMVKVITAKKDQHVLQIRELLLEHLQWANAKVKEEFEVSFNTAAMLEGDMKDLDKFMPPQGRLLLAYNKNRLAGIACLKALTPHIGEIKRMYVRPGNHKQGLGRALLNRLLEEACQIGYEQVRLDSAPFMTEVHHLYRTTGFTEIDAYEGSEIPEELQGHWIFMENVLAGKKVKVNNRAG